MGDSMRSRFAKEIQSLIGNERGFIHKKLLGGISKLTGFIPTPVSQIISRVTGRLAGKTQQKQAATAAKFGAPVTAFARHEAKPGHAPGEIHIPHSGASLVASIPCLPGFERGPDGKCRFRVTGITPGGAASISAAPVGDAVMGQYGAALQPGSLMIDRAVCLPGMQLGKDGLCYNKGQITNKQRMWPAGRKPLLSGGDMRAISTAARAGRRMDLATKRLQKMGMMKKPARRLPARGHHHHPAAGGSEH